MRKWDSIAADLRCDTCGQFPPASRTRLAIADIVTVLPIEFVVNLLVIRTDLPELAQLILMTVPTTFLMLWVTEPSIRRLLRAWLHAATLTHRHRLRTSPALWRAHARIPDEPGALGRLARSLARLDVNILDVRVHRSPDGAIVDEFILSTAEGTHGDELVEALVAGGGTAATAVPTSPVAVIDGQTRALSLAVSVLDSPGSLPEAAADLLSAHLADPSAPGAGSSLPDRDPTVLTLPSPDHGVIRLVRPGEPFTAAESARAHRLAQIAEIATIRGRATAQHEFRSAP